MTENNNNVRVYLPNLSKPATVQLRRFLIFFFLVGLTLSYSWLGAAFHLCTATILIIAIFTIVYPQIPIIYYTLGYSLILSALLDIIIIVFNWGFGGRFWQFYFSFVLAIIMIIFKVYYGLTQIQIAKDLNNEPPLPFNVDNIFNFPRDKGNNQNSNNNQAPNSNQTQQTQYQQQTYQEQNTYTSRQYNETQNNDVQSL